MLIKKNKKPLTNKEQKRGRGDSKIKPPLPQNLVTNNIKAKLYLFSIS